MISPFFSIIVPVYNVQNYLLHCLESIKGQTYNNYEVICVNDGSTDGSDIILQEFCSQLQNYKVVSQKNKGLSAARNTGINASKGEYLFFLDSDDWIEEDTLEQLYSEINSEDIICFNARKVKDNGILIGEDKYEAKLYQSGWDYYNEYALKASEVHFVCVWQRVYKRSFIINNELCFYEGIYHEDNLFTPITLYNAKSLKVVSGCYYNYRVREGSIAQTSSLKHAEDIICVANHLSDFFIPKLNIDKQIVYREIAGEYFKVFLYNDSKISYLRKLVKWHNFKVVSKYPRHKRIFFLLRYFPVCLKFYLRFELLMRCLSKNINK